MEIFFRLLFGHFLADFTFQTNFIAKWKRVKISWLFVHVLIHPICYFALTWPYLGTTWVEIGHVSLSGWICIPIIALLHLAEDWFRVTFVNRGWPDNTLFYVWDQAIHIVVLALLTPIRSQPLATIWPILGTLFVIVTHFATVTIWFIEKDIYGRDYPETEEKYMAMLQRLVVWMSFFLPHPWWILILLFVLFTFGRHIWLRRVDFSWTSIVMGNSLAILCGVMSRFVLGYHF